MGKTGVEKVSLLAVGLDEFSHSILASSALSLQTVPQSDSVSFAFSMAQFELEDFTNVAEYSVRQ